MRSAPKPKHDKKILQDLVPLNALSDERFRKLSSSIVIEEVRSGHYLFRKGDRDNQTVYLLEGQINLIIGSRKVSEEIVAGSEQSRFPIAARQPRDVSARAAKKSVIARIDTSLLDAFLTWAESSEAKVSEISLEKTDDWMTRLLQSEIFRQLPPTKLQGLLIRMKPFEVKSGEAVIQQGESGDYYYMIHQGRCVVTQRPAGSDQDVVLAELSAGDSFGDDALISSAVRNATVTMLTDGVLMRLAREDFDDLLKTEMVRKVSLEQAAQLVADGAVWLDVRTPDEHEHNAIEDSVNIPMSSLREQLAELMYNAKYILCCDTGQRSESAGFMLMQKGFDVYVLDGGLDAIRPEPDPLDEVLEDEAGPAVPFHSEGQDAEAYAELEALRNEKLALQKKRDEQDAHMLALQEQFDLLREELGEANGKMAELYAQAGVQESARQDLLEENASIREALDKQVTSLQEQLGKERDSAQMLREQIDSESSDRLAWSEELLSAKNELQSGLADAHAELALARQQLEQEAAQIVRLTAGTEDLRKQNEHLVNELNQLHENHEEASSSGSREDEFVLGLRAEKESLAQELESVRADLAAALQASAEQDRQLKNKVEQLEKSLNVALADKKLADEQAESSLEELRELQRHANSVEEQDAGKQQQLGALQQELDDALAAWKLAEEQVAASQLELRELQSVLSGSREESGSRKHEIAQLQSDLNSANDELVSLRRQKQDMDEQVARAINEVETDRRELAGKIRQLESDAATVARGYEEKLSELAVELNDARESAAASKAGHDDLQCRLDEANTDKARLELDLERTLQQVESREGLLAGRVTELQEKLNQKEQELDGVAGALSASNVRLQQLDEELLFAAGNREQLEEKIKQLSASLEGYHATSIENDLRVRNLEDELQKNIAKAHDDLRRKNDNERELQGQIERLRKKLDQAGSDYQRLRRDDQGNIDHLREELHAERQARAEERAEMAARQRELKEQLAQIASEHESNFGNQSGVIEEAVEAVRAEERLRMQGVLDSQALVERQLEQVKEELRRAHDELAALHHEEKERRQKDIEIMARQSEQSEAAISQLQIQLRQLTDERDEALERQRELQQNIEMQRAKSLPDMDPAGADAGSEVLSGMAELASQLDDARNRIAIEMRLRAEAEAARDCMVEERDRLLSEKSGRAVSNDPVHGGLSDTSPQPHSAQQTVLFHGDVTESQATRWLAMAIGLFAVLVVVGVGWSLFGNISPSKVSSDTAESSILPQPVEVVVPSTGNEESTGMPGTGSTVASMSGQESSVRADATGFEFGPVLREFSDLLSSGGRGPDMVELAAASFEMGSPGNSINADEVPRHAVTLKAFSISRNEITFVEYDRYARATGKSLPKDESWGRGLRPVINVSWEDARQYADWLSAETGKRYRLPTEAEWEYAARAGSADRFWWSDKSTSIPANCFDCANEWSGRQTAPVAQFTGNAFGLHDMSGNVQEWVADCYMPNYENAAADGSAAVVPMCTQRVARGGAYSSPLDSLRNARRTRFDASSRLDNLGFRVVREY